jgi:4-hydroxybenzoate polyprenyltransferase
MALFLSLSVAKRHTELSRSRLQNKTMEGRGYRAADEPLLLAMGITTAVSSVVILILYLVAEGFRAGQYEQPAFLWGAPAIIFIWQMRIWLLSQRGELDDDPVAFAIRDQPSIQLGASLVMVVLAAYFGVKLPWF